MKEFSLDMHHYQSLSAVGNIPWHAKVSPVSAWGGGGGVAVC